MSVQFRQRTPGEYVRIIWKRKWLIILPAIAIAVSIAWVVQHLPNVYESSTLIVVKPSTISPTIVPAPTEDMLTRQLSVISQAVTGRTSLKPLIERYHLYEQDFKNGESMETVLDWMKKDIKVEISSNKDVTNGFTISYRSNDPHVTQAVTAELASKYVDAQTKVTSENGQFTKEFFDQKVEQAKAELDDVDRKRLEFMRQNIGHLPGEDGTLGVRLTGLFEQQKSLLTEIGRLHDQETILSRSLGDLKKQRQQTIENIIVDGNDPKKLPEYTQLVQQQNALEAEKRDMLTKLRPANPDVIKKQQEIDAIKAKIAAAIEEGKAIAEEKRIRYEKQDDPQINLTTNTLESVKGQITRQQQLLDDTNSQINLIQQRLNDVPGAKVGLDALDREYLTKKTEYDNYLAQQQKADVFSGMQTSQQGESIFVQDPAFLPDVPVAPKRQMLILIGIAFGLCVGFGLAAIFEGARLLTIQSTSDAEHYTGLPVLVTLPELLTPKEARTVPRRRLLLLAAGIIATIISIPAIAYVLKMSHFFDRFA